MESAEITILQNQRVLGGQYHECLVWSNIFGWGAGLGVLPSGGCKGSSCQ